MSQIVWDESGKKTYEVGVDHGVLYLPDEAGAYKGGVAWNGLTAVNETASGGEPNPLWADNIKYLNLISAEEFGGTIEAYTYPKEFEECDGRKELVKGAVAGQQVRKPFGLSYRTKLGNDSKGEDYGYKLHLVYGCQASPSERSYNTINDSPDAITFSWEFTTTPLPVKAAGFKPTACITVDSTIVGEEKMKTLESKLYGNEGEAELPTPDEVIELLKDQD